MEDNKENLLASRVYQAYQEDIKKKSVGMQGFSEYRYSQLDIANAVKFSVEYIQQWFNLSGKGIKQQIEEVNNQGLSYEQLLDCEISRRNYDKRKLPDLVFTKDISIDSKALYLKGDIYDTYHYNYDRLVNLLMERIIKIKEI
jgi:hypothetical protein